MISERGKGELIVLSVRGKMELSAIPDRGGGFYFGNSMQIQTGIYQQYYLVGPGVKLAGARSCYPSTT
jgi:hypothetical protein